MAADKEVAKLKSDIRKIKEHLRDQRVWELEVKKHLDKVFRLGSVGSPPTVTDPPKPPR
jgi:hypothetical protein